MTKVVYNNCFGGFSLSADAVRLGKSLSTSEHWNEVCEKYGQFRGPRHDATLVFVVERLGEKANGDCARLAVEDIYGDREYKIDEYDGNETVVRRGNEYGWVAV